MTESERIKFSLEWLKCEYIDSWGQVVQHDGDGGDSAYRTALAVFLLSVLDNEIEARELWTTFKFNCEISPGLWIRHPDPTKWYSNPNNFSRDQMAKVELAAFAMKDNYAATCIITRMNQRNFFHQNTHKGTGCEGDDCIKMPDFSGVGEAHNFLRFQKSSLLSWILDFRFFGELIFRRFQSWDYDSLLLADLIYSRVREPSPISWIAGKIYKHTTDWKQKIRNNYSRFKNGVEPLGELYIIAGEKYL